MAVTMLAPRRLDFYTYQFRWSSDLATPTFYVYAHGRYLGPTTAQRMIFRCEPGQSLRVEVYDAFGDAPSFLHPDTIRLFWYAVASADHYLVEQYIDTSWESLAKVPHSDRENAYTWDSAQLADNTTHQFRVSAIDAAGNASTAVERSMLMVRHPDPPVAALSYNPATREPTITLAS